MSSSNLSFSENVKQELIKIYPKKLSERQALLAGFFCTAKSEEPGVPSTVIVCDKACAELLMQILGNDGVKAHRENSGDQAVISVAQECKKEFQELYSICFRKDSPEALASDLNFTKSFLRGVFLSCGYCSNPEKAYRIDLLIKNQDIVMSVISTLYALNVEPSVTMRDDLTVVYFKGGDEVSDFLGFIGAVSSVLRFENIRAEHEVKKRVVRLMNCDSGNFQRQADAGARRTHLFEKLLASSEGALLPDELKEAAKVAIMNPGASIAELGKLMNPPLTKSGMNHRLKKLEDLANSLN